MLKLYIGEGPFWPMYFIIKKYIYGTTCIPQTLSELHLFLR